MHATWLHISDFHIRGGDPYDRDIVLKSLVHSISDFGKRGLAADVIFATGDITYSGKKDEYVIATKFFDDLLECTRLDKARLYVIPGNHDVDRDLSVGLQRTLATREESDIYFAPAFPKPHLTQKQEAFVRWHNRYFKGVRAFPEDSTCSSPELLKIGGLRFGVLAMNSALFCQDDYDHGRLLIGRRCLQPALATLQKLDAHIRVALVHHPLDWLNSIERSNIKFSLQAGIDLLLRGHLHETEIETIVSADGQYLCCAAGAAYQTRRWQNRAMYVSIDESKASVVPIRYEDSREIWTIDASVFPSEPSYKKSFPIPRLAGSDSIVAAVDVAASPRLTVIPGNIPLRRFELVGRNEILNKMLTQLGSPAEARILVLHGLPGVGKTEVAYEFARRHSNRYPGGAFVVDVSVGALVSVMGGKGVNISDLFFRSELNTAPFLLIYDDVRSFHSVEQWLPTSGMACHALITTNIETWSVAWLSLEIVPLSHPDSLALIEQLSGPEVLRRYGKEIAEFAGGLPVQLCSTAQVLNHHLKHDLLDSVQLTISHETVRSFRKIYERLEATTQLLLQSIAFLNSGNLPREELSRQMTAALDWNEAQFRQTLTSCLEVHLLEGGADLKMHRLLARFLLSIDPRPENISSLNQVRRFQARRFIELARCVSEDPLNLGIVDIFMIFPHVPQAWKRIGEEFSREECEAIGKALQRMSNLQQAELWVGVGKSEKASGENADYASPSQ